MTACARILKNSLSYRNGGGKFTSKISSFLPKNGTLVQRCMFSSYPPHTLYPMPALSPTMETGTISSWKIGAGQSFAAGDVLCEIETDKATIDFEAQDDGIIAKILKEGKDAVDLKVGVPICVVVDDEDDVSSFANYTVEEDKPDASSADSAPNAPNVSDEEPSESTANVSLEHILMPAARHLSRSRGLDATGLKGSGKGGRVTKADVLKALQDGISLPPLSTTASLGKDTASPSSSAVSAATPSSTPIASPPVAIAPADVVIPTISTSGTFTDVRNNNMRKVIARRLTESKSTVPHFYATAEVELDNIMTLRKKLKDMEVKVSVNDLIIRASALALRDVPEVNSSFSKGGGVKMNSAIDISVAVATPGGLITPILHNTDQLGLSDISSKVKDLATRARDGKLAPEEYQGGTFCISNLGMFGINEFSAVINPPQAAILAVGGGVKKVIVNTVYDENEKIQEQPCVKNVMSARLSADRRVVDEATAGLFLSALTSYLTKPELLLL